MAPALKSSMTTTSQTRCRYSLTLDKGVVKTELNLSNLFSLGTSRVYCGDAQFPGMVITSARLEPRGPYRVHRVKILKKAHIAKLLKDQSGTVVGIEHVQNAKISTALGPVNLPLVATLPILQVTPC